jgi:hypothetical protein
MPPSYVKPYVKRQKNDAADAEAICEAVTRPTMRFVEIKSGEQQSIMVLHRVRLTLMRQRKVGNVNNDTPDILDPAPPTDLLSQGLYPFGQLSDDDERAKMALSACRVLPAGTGPVVFQSDDPLNAPGGGRAGRQSRLLDA